MLKNYLHKDVFQAGIQIYLHDYSYGSTCSDNLWDSMNKVNLYGCILKKKIYQSANISNQLSIYFKFAF